MAVVYSFKARSGQNIKVELVRQAEVLLLDEENYQNRRSGRDYLAMGHHITESPTFMLVPRSGEWRLVIEDHEQSETAASLVA
jgi:hypothetical protein